MLGSASALRTTPLGDSSPEDDDASTWRPRTAVAAMTRSRAATRILRIRIGRGGVRARLLYAMRQFKAAWRCLHVWGFRYAGDTRAPYHRSMRVLIVEDEPYMADAIRDGLRLEAIAADIAGDGETALALLDVNVYDIAVLDRDIPGPAGDEIAERIVASGSGMPILMLTAADRLDDKTTGFELGADDYLTKPFELQELVLRL